jgi:LmbE family N-acetylglucosaminyl deacetylase
MGACTDAAVAAMTEGDRPAHYHIAVDGHVTDFYRDAMRLTTGSEPLPLVAGDQVDVVFDLDSDEVMMKLRAIDCHRSQLEDWRIVLREHPQLMQRGYGHEPYNLVPSRGTSLTAGGLLEEFA